MAPTIGRLALHNRSYGSILGDWVAPPPQNIHRSLELESIISHMTIIFEVRTIYRLRWEYVQEIRRLHTIYRLHLLSSVLRLGAYTSKTS